MLKKINVIGYRTFITKKIFKMYDNVAICFVPNYRRILLNSQSFPFAIPDSNYKGFYALKFIVSKEDLKNLDFYEGISSGFYKRKEISVLSVNLEKKRIKAYIYIPTQKTIKDLNLSLKIDLEDKWVTKIKKYPEICEKFPLLIC